MEPQHFVWLAVIISGAVLGIFLRLAVVGWIILGLFVVAIVGAFAAAMLHLVRQEWLLLLIGAPIAAGVMFGAAALTNSFAGPSTQQGAGKKRKSP